MLLHATKKDVLLASDDLLQTSKSGEEVGHKRRILHYVNVSVQVRVGDDIILVPPSNLILLLGDEMVLHAMVIQLHNKRGEMIC